jgi:hypothetical protein
MGISDGVNNVWILRRHGSLDLQGFTSDIETQIETAVAHALKHNDEAPEPSSDAFDGEADQ